MRCHRSSLAKKLCAFHVENNIKNNIENKTELKLTDQQLKLRKTYLKNGMIDLRKTDESMKKNWKQIAEMVKSGAFKKIVVMVGAGISVAAGIPDFRTPGKGLYFNFQKFNLPSPTDMFNIDFFMKHPDAFYKFAKEIWPGKNTPTLTHEFLKMLQDSENLLRVYTQNIDGLEKTAGIKPQNIVEVHGSFESAHVANTNQSVPIKELYDAIHFGKYGPHGWKALSKKYGGYVKPNITFFGENTPKRFHELYRRDFRNCDLLIIMGTSLKVSPFKELIGQVKPNTPRVLIDITKPEHDHSVTQNIKELKKLHLADPMILDFSNARDILYHGTTDAAVTQMM